MEFRTLSKRLREFSDRECGQGVSTEHIVRAEVALGVSLPSSYRAFLREFGWVCVKHLAVFGLGDDVPIYLELINVTLRERGELQPFLPPLLVPLMNDGAGSHYCLDTRVFLKDECNVVFWNHELGQDQVPMVISPSFAEWLVGMLDELSEV